nr:glycosyltransferase family A protein [Moraxella sp.]
MRFSIIVPVYNVEDYLDTCLKSILAQSFTDYEVIIIDDGSTDNSKKILDELIFNLPKNKSKQFKVFSQKNQVQSAARNKALNIACGEYVGFIDSDDILDGNYIRELLRIINGYEPDIISIRAARFKKIIDDQDVISEMKLLDKVG